jgi:hypothetical protein
LRRPSQPEKQEAEIASIDEGIAKDSSNEQDSNAETPRIDSLDPDSKARFARDSHSLKQKWEIVGIDEGMELN